MLLLYNITNCEAAHIVRIFILLIISL